MTNFDTFQWKIFDNIENFFLRYGKIEKCEFFLEKFPKNGENDEYYGYVTFTNSSSAFSAVKDGKIIKKDLRVIPADTWKQPDNVYVKTNIADNDEIALNRLNDDCLLEIFEYLDLPTLLNLCRVCERFRMIIHDRILPFHKKISFDLTPTSNGIRSLTTIHDIMTNVGVHITNFQLKMDLYNDFHNSERLIDVITKNFTENLEKLELHGVFLNDRLYEQLKPILKHLKAFKWHDTFRRNHKVCDFRNFCPNVRKLKLTSFMPFHINSGAWKSLENVTLCNMPFEIAEHQHFLRENTQIKVLKINTFDYFEFLNSIFYHFSHLDVLKLYCCSAPRARLFRELENFKQLKTLRVSQVHFNDGDEAVFINIVSQLETLERLELVIEDISTESLYRTDDSYLPVLGKNLPNLKQFLIGQYYLTDKLVLDFIKVTPKLTKFTFIDCEFKFTENLLNKIADIRKNISKESLKIFANDEDLPVWTDKYGIVTIHKNDRDSYRLSFIQ